MTVPFLPSLLLSNFCPDGEYSRRRVLVVTIVMFRWVYITRCGVDDSWLWWCSISWILIISFWRQLHFAPLLTSAESRIHFSPLVTQGSLIWVKQHKMLLHEMRRWWWVKIRVESTDSNGDLHFPFFGNNFLTDPRVYYKFPMILMMLINMNSLSLWLLNFVKNNDDRLISVAGDDEEWWFVIRSNRRLWLWCTWDHPINDFHLLKYYTIILNALRFFFFSYND